MPRGAQVFLWKTAYQLPSEVGHFLSELPDPDKIQAAKLSRDRRRIEFVCGRYLLRNVFANRFQVKLPDHLELHNNKPRVAKIPPFNLSHSKKFVSFAISDNYDIGLDIETEDDKRDILKIAETYGNAGEVSLLKGLDSSSRMSAFYKLWSLKESFAKATGDGLDLSLKNLKFNFEKSQILDTPQSQKCVIFHSKNEKLHLSVSILCEDAVTPIVWEVEHTSNGLKYKQLEDIHFEKFVVVVPGVPTYH